MHSLVYSPRILSYDTVKVSCGLLSQAAIFRTLLPSKPASPTPDIITSHNTTVSDPIAIANEFNHHFSNVGNVLANNIDNSDANSLISYLKHSCPSTIFVYPTTYHEIISLISALKLNKAESHDDIPPYF